MRLPKMDYRKLNIGQRILCALLSIIIILGLAAVIELAGFERKSVLNPKVSVTYTTGQAERIENPIDGRGSYLASGETITQVDESWINHYENPVYLRYNFQPNFFNRVQLTLTTDHEVPYTILVNTTSDFGTDKYTYLDDKASVLLQTGITEIKDVSKSVIIVMEEADAAQVSGVTFSNAIHFNYERWFLIIAILTAIAILTVFRSIFLDRLHLVFLILGLTFGISILFSHGITGLCWDEQIHFNCMYQMSYIGDVPQTESYLAYSNLQFPEVNTIDEQILLSQWADAHENMDTAERAPHNYPYTTFYGRVGYFVQAITMCIARAFGAGFTWQIYLANLANLLFYVILVSLAVKLCVIGKRTIFFIGLMPVPLLLATAFSYDAFVNSLLLLGYAIYTREYISKGAINYKRLGLAAGIMALGIIPKAVYFPVILMLAFLPKEKYQSVKERRRWVLILLIIVILLAATFVLPTIMSGNGGSDLYSDPRRTTANTYEQLMLILGHPLQYAKLLFGNILSWQLPWYFGMKSWTNLVYSGMYTGTGTYLVAIMLVFLAMTQGSADRYHLSDEDTETARTEAGELDMRPFKVGAVLLSFASELLIWTAMYLAFNPVGVERIKGLQGRYLFPFVFLMVMLFYNRKIECKMKKSTYNTIVIAATAFITSVTLYMVYYSGLWMNVL